MTATIVNWIANAHIDTGDIIVGAIAVWLIWQTAHL
jgi:hypothetical protein